MNKITNSFSGGKVVNCRGTRTYTITKMGIVEFKIDKNLAIYDVNPRKYIGRDVLSVVRGQVPDAGALSLNNAVSKWLAEDARYAN